MPDNNGISRTNDNKNSKPRTEQPNLVILTYSVSPNLDKTLSTLNKRGASVHYIIEKNGNQIQFTNDASEQTFTCGHSKFRNQTSLNQVSINVMLINDSEGIFGTDQINKLISFLQDVAIRYPSLDLKLDIAGLGEVAVQKDQPSPQHIAPGKFFPWEKLAEQGFGLFLPTTPEQKAEICISPASSKQEISDLQAKLKEYGYAITESGHYDNATEAWVTRFNERYVPLDANQKIDSANWSKASQLSLEYIHNHHINAQKQTITQTIASAPTLFKLSNNSDGQVGTDEVDANATAKIAAHPY